MRDVITDHAYFEQCLKDEYNKGYMDGINCVLDKIRAEIEQANTYDGIYIDRAYVLEIIDKYKAESEE